MSLEGVMAEVAKGFSFAEAEVPGLAFNADDPDRLVLYIGENALTVFLTGGKVSAKFTGKVDEQVISAVTLVDKEPFLQPTRFPSVTTPHVDL